MINAIKMREDAFVQMLLEWAGLSIDFNNKNQSSWKSNELDTAIGLALNIGYNFINEKVLDDLSKVKFEVENFGSYADPLNENFPLGLWTTSNGVPILGCSGSANWEYPVYFILYPESEKVIRGYVPKFGNTWNTKTKSAYGNNPIEDGHFKTWPEPDVKLYKEEIDKRLEAL